MKILIASCNFTPDPIGVGKFTGEMAEWLSAHGHDVRAVAAAPFYPQWKIADGYSGMRYRRERVRGVDIMRCPIYVPKKQSGLGRLLQHFIFLITSAPVLCIWAWRWKPDVVWTVMPPMAGMPGALIAAKLARAPAWLHVQDFEVDAAFELGLLNSTGLRRLLLWAEKKMVSAFSIVSSITPKMLDQFVSKKVLVERFLFPNWADLDLIYPLAGANSLREDLGISPTHFVALYSGNMGEKQGLGDLVEVARILAKRPGFMMVICGDGVGKSRLMAQAKGLENILFLQVQPSEKFNALLNIADVHLLPQKPEIADLVMPSKLLGMLASGRPVVAGAHPGTQLAQEVAKCGIVIPPGDVEAMSVAIEALMDDPERRQQLGEMSVMQARERWSKEEIISRFEQKLLGLHTRS